jgi:hypothetical protein
MATLPLSSQAEPVRFEPRPISNVAMHVGAGGRVCLPAG